MCVLSTFSNISFENTGPIEAKFHLEPPWGSGTEVCSNDHGHMTKMAAMPICGRTVKNLLRNQKADDLETWYVASDTQVLPILFNDDPGLTFIYFMARSNLVPCAFVWEKGETMIFQKLL